MFELQHLQDSAKNPHWSFFVLTVWKSQNTDDEEEGDDQDEPHPEVTVRVSIVSANNGRLVTVRTSRE